MQTGEPTAPKRRSWTKRHPTAVVLSLLVHGAAVLALLLIVVPKPRPVEPPAVNVALIPALVPGPEAPASRGEPAAAAPTPAKTPKAPVAKSLARRTPIPPPPEMKTMAAGKADTIAPMAEVSPAELAGAATAEGEGEGTGGGGGTGSGSGGGACNMVRRLQEALRKDQLVLSAAHTPAAAGRALRVWNGDWVQSSGEDGKGLAAVREAIVWEVAFAPAACRAQPVHGLVMVSLGDGLGGGTRLALGAADWRWSDLLGLKVQR